MLHTTEYVPSDWHSPSHRRIYSRLQAALIKEGDTSVFAHCPPSAYVAYHAALNVYLSKNPDPPMGQLVQAIYQPKALSGQAEPLAAIVQDSPWVWSSTRSLIQGSATSSKQVPKTNAEMILKPALEQLLRFKFGGSCQRLDITFNSYDPWQFNLVKRYYLFPRMPYLVLLSNIAGFWVDAMCQNGSQVHKYSLVCSTKPPSDETNVVDQMNERNWGHCSDRVLEVSDKHWLLLL